MNVYSNREIVVRVPNFETDLSLGMNMHASCLALSLIILTSEAFQKRLLVKFGLSKYNKNVS